MGKFARQGRTRHSFFFFCSLLNSQGGPGFGSAQKPFPDFLASASVHSKPVGLTGSPLSSIAFTKAACQFSQTDLSSLPKT